MRMLSILSILILMCTAVVANAGVLAYDDFSSGDESGGFGWAAEWVNNDGTPTTMNFSTADPLSDGISDEYLSQGELIYYPKRALATPLNASTTPEFWGGVYLRPETLADSGWMFGFQLYKDDEHGALCGLILGDNNDYIRLANTYAGSPVGDGTSQFTLDQETMLVMRFYKDSPTDTMYNRVDLYADLDGSDGRYNNEVAIATGFDLGSFSTDEIALLRINQSGYLVDFDFVAIGTTKESVVYPLP